MDSASARAVWIAVPAALNLLGAALLAPARRRERRTR
jgi:hypothetical protein